MKIKILFKQGGADENEVEEANCLFCFTVLELISYI
jgi:hypothetical protein